MYKHFFTLIFCAGVVAASGQTEVDSDTTIVDSLEVAAAEEEMLYKEDTTDFIYYTLPSSVEFIPGEDHPQLLADRLSCIQKTVPLKYNDKVHAFIHYFTVKDRDYTRMMMRRKDLYFPIFEKQLAKYKMPDELKYLAIIESGLNPRAVSRASAVGLWQFMSPTGRYYGLYQDWYVDDRMDPLKATDAACRYLKDLYSMFNDWELALAAYNTGPGNVKKAIRRAGYKKSFWEIYPYLPRETRSYVPQFVAVTYTMNYLEEHNFIDEGKERLMACDTLTVNKFLHFETLAALTGICLDDLQRLNPSVRHNALPDDSKKYTLLIPTIAKQRLDKNRLAILDSASKVGKSKLEALVKSWAGGTYGRDRIVYKVKSGDVLGKIALRYGVKVTDLKKWNNLNSNIIRVGQRLNIWVKPAGGPALASSRSSRPAVMPLTGSKTYVVQPGDTLWDISRKFEGLTIEKLKTLNNLRDNKIHAGQKLIVGI